MSGVPVSGRRRVGPGALAGPLPGVLAGALSGVLGCALSGALPRALLVALLAASLPTSPLPAQQPAPAADGTERGLRGTIDAVVTEPPLNQVHWGVLVVDPATGRSVYSRNAENKFVPASNQKILVTATAFALLRPDYRYTTSLWTAAEVDGRGVLHGDLVLPGTGDPTLSDRFHESATAPLEALTTQVAAAGIREVRGALVVDASRWDSTSVPGSWMVGNLAPTYGATGGAFAIAEGTVSIEVTAASQPGDPARIRWWPQGRRDFVVSEVSTVVPELSDDLRADYLPESRRLVVRGVIPWGTVDTIQVAARDPVRLASEALLRALEYRGIRVDGGVRVAWTGGEPLAGGCYTGSVMFCPSARQVALLASPPMREIAQATLEPSQNWIAEQLVRTLGMEYGDEGSWREGFHVMERFLTEEVGVDSLDLSMRDGSGLSAYNLVTPRALVSLLSYMWSTPHYAEYRDALASPEEEESTLERRLRNLRGRVFAKTGTITHVNALSGYVLTAEGRELVFSILTNGSGLPSGRVRDAMDEVLEAVAR